MKLTIFHKIAQLNKRLKKAVGVVTDMKHEVPSARKEMANILVIVGS